MVIMVRVRVGIEVRISVNKVISELGFVTSYV